MTRMLRKLAPLVFAPLVGSCLPPPGCESACETIVGTCGLGDDTALCVDACRDVPKGDFVRHDARDCVAVADCGHLASGACTADGVDHYYVVFAPDCLDGARSMRVHDGTVETTSGGWGDLGPPALADDGTLTFGGECATPLTVGVGAQGDCVRGATTCRFYAWPVL